MASRRIQRQSLLPDQRAQALVEFAIVMPVILLFFLGTLQYLEVVRASQHANLAAYQAARVYCVRASVDGKDTAIKLATQAAALALAPVAELKPGEIPLINVGSSSLLPGFLQGNSRLLGRLAMGYAVAYFLRLDPKSGGGSVTIREDGAPRQVFVEINYPQPIYIPGFAGLWNLVAGPKIFTGMAPLRQGLTGMPSNVLPVLEEYEQLEDLLGLPPINLSNLPLPYVNVRGKCAMGYEDWGSIKPDYRPRIRDTVENSRDAAMQEIFDKSASDAKQAKDNSDGDGKQRAKDDANDLEGAKEDERNRCTDLKKAKKTLELARAQNQPIIDSRSSTALEKQKANTAISDAEGAVTSAQTAYNTAHGNREQRQRNFEKKYDLMNNPENRRNRYSYECN